MQVLWKKTNKSTHFGESKPSVKNLTFFLPPFCIFPCQKQISMTHLWMRMLWEENPCVSIMMSASSSTNMQILLMLSSLRLKHQSSMVPGVPMTICSSSTVPGDTARGGAKDGKERGKGCQKGKCGQKMGDGWGVGKKNGKDMGMEIRKGTDKEQARNSKEMDKKEGRNGQGMGKTTCKEVSSGKLNKLYFCQFDHVCPSLPQFQREALLQVAIFELSASLQLFKVRYQQNGCLCQKEASGHQGDSLSAAHTNADCFSKLCATPGTSGLMEHSYIHLGIANCCNLSSGLD